MPGRKWTEAELRYLMVAVYSMHDHEIALALTRFSDRIFTKKAVERKRFKLGIRLKRGYGRPAVLRAYNPTELTPKERYDRGQGISKKHMPLPPPLPPADGEEATQGP